LNHPQVQGVGYQVEQQIQHNGQENDDGNKIHGKEYSHLAEDLQALVFA
jgi:hypothetical protein